MNFFQRQTAGSFICCFNILMSTLAQLTLSQLRGGAIHFVKNQYTMLLYECYQYIVSCLFSLDLDY